jgi:hypothetical protein
MRKLIYILLFYFIYSCGITEAEEIDFAYIMENNSDSCLLVNFFISQNTVQSIQLFPGELVRFEGFTRFRPSIEDSNGTPPNLTLPAENLEIIFNNESRTMYSVNFQSDSETFVFSEPINRNPFRNGNYEILGNDEFLYAITTQDFENATPCDGACE